MDLHSSVIVAHCVGLLFERLGADPGLEEDYGVATGATRSGNAALDSLQIILRSGVRHEVRTTVHAALLPPPALARLARSLAGIGVRDYALQEFRARGAADTLPRNAGSYLSAAFCATLAPLFSTFTVRRA